MKRYKIEENWSDWESIVIGTGAGDHKPELKKLIDEYHGTKPTKAGTLMDDDDVLHFATEHIFELQQIDQLFKHPPIKTFFETHSALAKLAFKDKTVFGTITPLEKLARSLPSAPDAFIYLERNLNGLKAVYLAGTLPEKLNILKKKDHQNTDDKELRSIAFKLIRTTLLGEYLNNTVVQHIYKDIVLTLRETWIEVGKKFSENTKYKILGTGLQWEHEFDAWQKAFVPMVQNHMNEAITYGVERLEEAHKKKKYAFEMSATEYPAFKTRVSAHIDISGLLRHLEQAAPPDADPVQAANMDKLAQKARDLTISGKK